MAGQDDLFEFWSRINPNAPVHPDDQPIFDRLGNHQFNMTGLPSCYMGPLKTAPVVLLYLSPGLGKEDEVRPTPEHVDWLQRNRGGLEPLVPSEIHPGAYKWWTSRTKRFGRRENVSNKITFLNIGAYRSREFKDYSVLATLPSSRTCLNWVQSVLFPQAERGERVVVCMRAARWWGLNRDKKYAGTLFAPKVVRGGHMAEAERDIIIAAARDRMGAAYANTVL